jgi:hypothetical protein
MTLQIQAVKVLPEFRVRLRLSDGSYVERGLRRVIRGGVFEPLRQDYALFRRVRVHRGVLTWPGGVDLDPETVIWGGAPPAGEIPPKPWLEVRDPISDPDPDSKVRARSAEVDGEWLVIILKSGDAYRVPISWFPKLVAATPEQRQRSRLVGRGVGIRWDELDEDLSVEGLVRSAAWVGLQTTSPGGQASSVGP